MLPWLVADIGGTNARFGWVEDDSQRVQRVRTLPVAQYRGIDDAVRAYLAAVQQDLGAGFRPPQQAAFAMATPITGDAVTFTNSHWRFSHAALRADLGLQTLLLLNDFEALALSLPRLGADQLRAHRAMSPATGTLAVIGPGTGLGVGAVVPTRRGWVPVSGEGGHATLAPADDFEADLLRHARAGHPHVSAERFLSGIGLPTLHAAVSAVLGSASEELAAEAIVEHGLKGDDPLCSRTIDAFCALLGSFAGNVALTLGARGGVYIGGGIVPRLGDRFFASAFRERFEAKGRFRAYLEQVPTAVIIDTLAALSGAAQAIAQHER